VDPSAPSCSGPTCAVGARAPATSGIATGVCDRERTTGFWPVTALGRFWLSSRFATRDRAHPRRCAQAHRQLPAEVQGSLVAFSSRLAKRWILELPMPRDTSVPPSRCPCCAHADPTILFINTRIVTARCMRCLHIWVAPVHSLPRHVPRSRSAIERSRGLVTH
jgi:hypothetical protein